jgi:hypothetical protein
MDRIKIAVSSKVPVSNKYKNLKHKVLKYDAEKLQFCRQTCLGFYFLGPDDVRNVRLGAMWNFIKRTGLP